jgi:DNA-binding MarR family transcriptional regulator
MITTQNLSPHQKTLVNQERKATAAALFAALEPFVKESPHMPISNFMAFLRVAAEEGKGVTEYADDAGVYKTIMTRHLLDLGPRDRHGGEGLGWITQARRNDDLRVNRAWVTQKGASMIDTARRALELLVRK